jgi:hypothetical protein
VNDDEDLKKLQENIYKGNILGEIREDPYKEITPLDRLRKGMSNISSTTEEEYLQPFDIYSPQLKPSDEEKHRALEDKLLSKFKPQRVNQ